MNARVIVTAWVVSSAFGLVSCSKQQAPQSQQTSGAVGTAGQETRGTGGTVSRTPEADTDRHRTAQGPDSNRDRHSVSRNGSGRDARVPAAARCAVGYDNRN